MGEQRQLDEAVEQAIRELSDLVEDLNDGPWGATADPQLGIQNVIDFTLKPALAAAEPRGEKRKEGTNMDYPYQDGDVTVLGPECFTDGEVICWKGENFVRQSEPRGEELRRAAAWLLRLKAGPRDERYEREKPQAWKALFDAMVGAVSVREDGER